MTDPDRRKTFFMDCAPPDVAEQTYSWRWRDWAKFAAPWLAVGLGIGVVIDLIVRWVVG